MAGKKTFLALLLGICLLPRGAQAGPAPGLDIEVLRLPNGMTFLLVDRPSASVSAGWVARVGSADDPAGQTGLAHFLEHLMFKGTRTIGTTDYERELPLMAEQDEVYARLLRLRGPLQAGGEEAAAAAREAAALQERFQQLIERHRALLVRDEYDLLYGRAGASGMNAFTTVDFTGYFMSVPANRLELWFWMESDRLLAPVFRELYPERLAIDEERNRRESGPTGPFLNQLDALFWQSHPYRWPRLGWPLDVEALTPRDAMSHFRTWYGPANLTAVLVGRFDRQLAAQLAQRYFGRLPAAPEPVRPPTPEPVQRAETRMLAACNCPPQLEARYHTVPFLHPDAAALEVLAGLLNGRAGRLHKELVLGARTASEASAAQSSALRAGHFSIRAQAAPEGTPESLEQGWYGALRSLQEELVPPRELERVRNTLAADAFRQMEDPFNLLVRLLTYAGQGDWRYIEEQPKRIQAVTAEDVRRVARTYFQPENRTVALYRRAETGGGR